MKILIKAYYYLFYKFYKMSEAASSKWLSDWKAGVCVIALEIWTILFLVVYYVTITKTYIELNVKMSIVFIPLLIVLLINYFAFVHSNVWKQYVKDFDRLPEKQNRIGSWIVFGIVLFVIANLVFSFYLMSKVDWSQYS